MANCTSLSTVKITSPIGNLDISGCNNGMHSVKRSNEQLAIPDVDVKCEIIESHSENIPASIEQSVEWIKCYFSITSLNDKQRNLILFAKFSSMLYTTAAKKIRFGSRVSYGDLASMVNNPRASRAVGTCLKRNPFMIIIPCHRITPKSGGIGSYGGKKDLAPLKQWLIEYEEEIRKELNIDPVIL
ncbi:hypothetical protein BLOT_007423 [Blomia tropicalis]|nr:hypothetical protein BLOT_007423 [Blomia tropicalis]